jgi:hypothetical protein
MIVFSIYSIAVIALLFAKRKDFLLPIFLMISLTVVKLITFPNFWLDAVIVTLVARKIWRCIVYDDQIIIDNLTIVIFIYILYLAFNLFIHFEQKALMEFRQIINYLILYPLFLNVSLYERFEIDQVKKGLLVCAALIILSCIVFYMNPLAYLTIANELDLFTNWGDVLYNKTYRFISVFRSALGCSQAMMMCCFLFFVFKRFFLSLAFYIMLLLTQTRSPIALTTLTFFIIGLKSVLNKIYIHTIYQKKQFLKVILIVLLVFLGTATYAVSNFNNFQNEINLERFTKDIFTLHFLKERSLAPKNFWFFLDRNLNSIIGYGIAHGEIVKRTVNDGNFYKVLHEHGFIGFILYVFLYLFIFYRFIKTKDTILKTIYLIMFLIFLVGFTTTVITSYFTSNILFMSAGIIESKKIGQYFSLSKDNIIQSKFIT